MSEDPDERKLSISTTQVVASALAAMSVAFLTSWLGTAGTIIGACLGSVIATVGTAAYSWSLRRTSTVVKQTAAQVRQTALLTNTLPRTVAQGPLRKRASEPVEQPGEETSVLTPAEEAAAEAEVDPDAPAGRWDGFPWKKTLLATGAVLLLTVAGITVLEVATGQSMSSLSGHEDTNGTTVRNVLDGDKDQPETPSPSDEQSSTPGPGTPGGEETQAPPPEPQTSTDPSPTAEPSESTSPRSEPSSGASEEP
jgi:hypothetical protein